MHPLKALITVTILLVSNGSALAHHHGHRHWHHQPRPIVIERDWVTPLVLGGIAGAIIVREANKPAVVETQPIPRAIVVECTEWKEIQTSAGHIYKERICKEK